MVFPDHHVDGSGPACGPQKFRSAGHASGLHQAWIAADLSTGGVKLLITGPQGLERTLTFAVDDDPAVIAERVRETMED
jgi:hypothetical protein